MSLPTSAADPRHLTEDQSETFALLGDPATHGIDEPVRRIDTHGAVVFLAGARAYKVKRAVRFPFMDYSTLEKRRRACEAEISINRPGAPDIYQGVVAITRRGGRLGIGGDGEPVEYAVAMRRFDERLTLDHVADGGGLDETLIDAVVVAVHASHRRAPVRPGAPAAAALATYLEQNREAFAEMPDVFPPDRAERLVNRSKREWDRLHPLLLARGDAGFVRRCHGDLHLRNIVLIDGAPTLFDAIEFDDGIATGDVLYDLAFLIMDVRERGLGTAANRIMNRYLQRAGPDMLGGIAALPLFLSIRATIRAKVMAAGLGNLAEDARPAVLADIERYFRLAEAALEPVPPVLVAIGGLSGSGKSTAAAALAASIGRIPGAVHLRSDTLRKRLAGVEETQPLPPSAYVPAARAAVYEVLREETTAVLRAGSSVIVDAAHTGAADRLAVAELAARAGARFAGIWLDAPVETLARRVAARVGDASDADADVVRAQAAASPGPIDWTRIAADRQPDAVVADIAEAVARSRMAG